MAVTVFVGAYAYAQEVLDAMPDPPMGVVTEYRSLEPRWQALRAPFSVRYTSLKAACIDLNPDLVVVAGWRRMVDSDLAPTIGFHSAKLPEYPGRAPVPNAILRGDTTLTNTMLWLTDEPDAGDIIDERTFSILGDQDAVQRGAPWHRSPDDIYRDIGRTSAEMLVEHWDALLAGTAPRRPQDPALRGPLTPVEAWQWLAS